MTNGNFPRRIGLTVAAVLVASGTALARNGDRPKASDLPGVKADYGIVKPAPEPEPDSLPAGNAAGTYFKVGDTEVRIGGYVRVDIGVGPLGAKRRR